MLTPPSRRRHDSSSHEPLPSVRVLVVDDDDNFRAWITHLMRRLGFAVQTANDGEEALALLRADSFDLLISDYQMPRVDGFELIRAIRADDALAHQYAVMLTSREDSESKVTALTIGYDDFLTKGCTEVEVVAKVVAAKRVVARQRTLAVAAREWQTLASRDELTGVSTRRALFDEAESHLRRGRSIGLAILDLDDFKPINDTFGHLTGDRILRDLGALFLGRTRANDVIARYGGDEFLLLVTDATLDDLNGAAERMLDEIRSRRWELGGQSIGVTASAGIAHSSLLPNATLEQLLEAADRDLYAHKWVKKHPGANPELYRYPGRSSGGKILSLRDEREKPARATGEA